MANNYMYIRFCSNESICLSNLKVKMINKCNKIVFDGRIDNFGKIRIPIYDNEVYKLIVYSNLSIIKIPLIAKKDNVYCINISNNNSNNNSNLSNG